MSFFKSSVIVSLGTLFSRILGFVRDILIARFLGAGLNSDILFIALKIPNTVRQIFGEGAFNLAFVPLFKKYCDDNNINPKALNFLENTFSLFMLAIFIILIIAEVFMPNILNFLAPSLLDKHGQEVFDLAVNIARIVMPYLLFVSYMTFMGAVLNSLGKFAAMAFAPAMVNVGYILAFALHSLVNINANITYVPAIGFLFGGFLQFLVMYISIKKMPFVIKFKKPTVSNEIKELFYKFIPTILGSGIVVVNSLVTVFLASNLAKGTVSHLFYAERLIQLPVALFGTAIATVLLPTLTQKIKQGLNVGDYFIKIFTLTLVVSVFCLLYINNFAELIVSTLFQRGEFSQQDSLNTAYVLAFMAFSIPCIMASKIANVVFYANSNTKLPLKISAISFLINLVLAFYLVNKYQVSGLLIASLVATVFSILAQIIMLILYKYINLIQLIKPFLITLLFGFILGFVYFILSNGLLFTISLEDAIIYKLLMLTIFGVLGLALTLVCIVLFKLYKRI